MTRHIVRIGRYRAAFLLLSAVMLIAGCSDTAVDDTTTAAPAETTTTSAPVTSTTASSTSFVPTLAPWTGYVSTLTVPLDHDDPTGPTVDVPVARLEATDPDKRIGALFVNPGGPGYTASPLVLFAEQVFTPELREHFDIVALDPRGTFADTTVNCFTGLADLWAAADYSPDAPGELEALDAVTQAWVDDCAADYGEMLDHVSTMDTVRDMAMLVEALGEEQVSYLGFSYGTTLGSAFVTEYPDLVRAAVFDGAYLAVDDPLESMLDSFGAMDQMLVRIFDECDSDPECPITDGAQAAFTKLAARADAEPIVGNRLLPTVNEQGLAAVVRFSDAAYGGSAKPLLQAVANANKGNFFELQSLLADSVALLEAGGSAMAISCMDYPYRELVPLPDDAVEMLDAAAPTFSAVFPTPEGFDPFSIPSECMRWPYGPDLLPDPPSGAGGGPVLVVTATEDPVTPMASARKLAAELVNGVLLIVDSTNHGSYQIDTPLRSEERACATGHIDGFLIDLEIPPDETFCGVG